jgi:hypothetical protein
MVRLVELYNRGDAPGLYALFDERARAEFSVTQLAARLVQLRRRLGSIEQFRYLRTAPPRTFDGHSIQTVVFALALSGGLSESGEVELALTMDQTQIDAWLFRLPNDPSSETTPGP